MKANIAILPGDGIGPEIVAEAVKVLKAVATRFGHDFDMTVHPVGGAAHDLCGDCLPDATLAACKVSDAVLLGAVGGPKWDALPPDRRPERRALLTLRSELGLFANLRPAKVWDALKYASPLKDEIVARGIDLLIVRELTGGAYFGEKGRSDDRKAAYDVTPYSAQEIERVARAAFDAARVRRRKVTSVDKANVLETSRLWRETVSTLHATEYVDVELEHMYVDNAAMQLVRNPARFDVILTENMFGDILSDEASQITGSIGMLPMLRHAFGLAAEAAAIERAVADVLASGVRTIDIASDSSTSSAVSTCDMGDAVSAAIAGGRSKRPIRQA